MARGRKPKDYVPQPPAEYDEAQAQAESQALTIVSAADELAYRMKALHVGKGRVETALFLHKIADIIIAKEFEEVTKSKDYLNITYLGKDEKLHKVQSIEEYCQVEFRLSYRQCAELRQNLRLLGAEVYEQAEVIGLRNVDYRALRALPADDQVLVKRAIEDAQSREAVIDLLQELAAKNQREREEREAKIAELQADAEANEKFLADKNKRIDTLERELARHERGAVPVNEHARSFMDELHTHGRECELQIRNLAIILHATDGLCDENAEKPLAEQDRRALVLLVQRLRDQIWRIARGVGELQHDYEMLLSGYIGGAEDFPLREPDQA